MSATSARERWEPLVRELEASGLSLRAYAQQRDVNPSTLSWWRSVLRREERVPSVPPAFAELTVAEPDSEPAKGRLVVT